MTEYRPDRRVDATPPLKPVSRNEASQAGDLRREKAWERAREAIADDLRRERRGKARAFAELVKRGR